MYIEHMSRGSCVGTIYLTLLGFGGIQAIILSYSPSLTDTSYNYTYSAPLVVVCFDGMNITPPKSSNMNTLAWPQHAQIRGTRHFQFFSVRTALDTHSVASFPQIHFPTHLYPFRITDIQLYGYLVPIFLSYIINHEVTII